MHGKASVIDLNTANYLFQEILRLEIPFEYQQANCHNLSHYIALFIASKSITCSKIWAFTPSVYSNSSTKLISFKDKKKLSPNGKIDWGYHVATVLHVRLGNKSQKMVIDPGLFPDKLVHFRTWLAKLKSQNLVYLVMDSEWYLFNSTLLEHSHNPFLEENIKPNVILPKWFSNKLITDFFKYEEESKENHWLEKGMAINETAIQFYNKEIKSILNSKSELLTDYKNLTGNVYNFETVFRDSTFNYEMTAEFQEKHSKVIEKYRKVYEIELAKWKNKLNQLQKNG